MPTESQHWVEERESDLVGKIPITENKANKTKTDLAVYHEMRELIRNPLRLRVVYVSLHSTGVRDNVHADALLSTHRGEALGHVQLLP